MGGTCDKILGKFQAHCSSVVCNLFIYLFIFYSLVKRFIVLLFTLLTCLEIMVGKMCFIHPLKHAHTRTHTLSSLLLAFRQDIYFSGGLFQRQSVSMVMAAHRSGWGRVREGGGREKEREREMIPPYLPLLCTCWHTYCICWYVSTQALNALSPPLPTPPPFTLALPAPTLCFLTL